MGLHFGFPGLEAGKEMLETWSWLQGGQKAGEVKVHERTGRQAGRHPLIHGFEHVPRLFVRWGWWGGMEAT